MDDFIIISCMGGKIKVKKDSLRRIPLFEFMELKDELSMSWKAWAMKFLVGEKKDWLDYKLEDLVKIEEYMAGFQIVMGGTVVGYKDEIQPLLWEMGLVGFKVTGEQVQVVPNPCKNMDIRDMIHVIECASYLGLEDEMYKLIRELMIRLFPFTDCPRSFASILRDNFVLTSERRRDLGHGFDSCLSYDLYLVLQRHLNRDLAKMIFKAYWDERLHVDMPFELMKFLGVTVPEIRSFARNKIRTINLEVFKAVLSTRLFQDLDVWKECIIHGREDILDLFSSHLVGPKVWVEAFSYPSTREEEQISIWNQHGLSRTFSRDLTHSLIRSLCFTKRFKFARVVFDSAHIDPDHIVEWDTTFQDTLAHPETALYMFDRLIARGLIPLTSLNYLLQLSEFKQDAKRQLWLEKYRILPCGTPLWLMIEAVGHAKNNVLMDNMKGFSCYCRTVIMHFLTDFKVYNKVKRMCDRSNACMDMDSEFACNARYTMHPNLTKVRFQARKLGSKINVKIKSLLK